MRRPYKQRDISPILMLVQIADGSSVEPHPDEHAERGRHRTGEETHPEDGHQDYLHQAPEKYGINHAAHPRVRREARPEVGAVEVGEEDPHSEVDNPGYGGGGLEMPRDHTAEISTGEMDVLRDKREDGHDDRPGNTRKHCLL